MPISTAIVGGIGFGFAVVAVVALFLLNRKTVELADLRVAVAEAHAKEEKGRADVAERQAKAANDAAQEAQDAEGKLIEDAIQHNGVIDPTREWDARTAPSGPVRVLSPEADRGPGRDAAPVSDHQPGEHPSGAVSAANAVPAKPPRS